MLVTASVMKDQVFACMMVVQSVWLAVVVIIMLIRVMPVMNKLFTVRT